MQIKGPVGITSAFRNTVAAISIVLGLLVITSALERSLAVGRLSFPPAYDDVGYFISGSNLYTLYLKNGLSAVFLPLLYEHAPFQSLLAMVGDHLFGLNIWSAYLANGFLVLGLVLILLIFTRALQPVARFAIILFILSLPLIGNLVTEFRPDIFWGGLCGMAIYLILSPAFLRSRAYTCVTAVAVALALLAKPSASPASAVLLGFAGLLALWLQWPLRTRLTNVGVAALIVLVIAGPFFAINAVTIYRYIHLGLVEQYGLFDDLNRSVWTDVAFYVNSSLNQYTLSTALWVSIGLFVWNAKALYLSGRRNDLIRYFCFAAATFVAYLIPTVSPIKSVFFGSIFYGTFLFFTVRGLILAFDARIEARSPEQRWFNLTSYIGPALLILLTATTYHGWALMSETYAKTAPEWNRAADQITHALKKAVVDANLPRPAVVFVTEPYPFSSANVSLLACWYGLNVAGDGGYYFTSLDEEKQHALRDDYVLISLKGDVLSALPGGKLGLSLLEWIRNSEDFELLSDFGFADGRHAYLFRKSETSISLDPGGGWIERKGLTFKVASTDLEKRPYLVFDGNANYKWLGGEPKPYAVLTTTDGAEHELPAWLVAKGQKYEVVLDAKAVPKQTGQQYSVHITFDRYFVPKALGINDDTRQLVIMMPAEIKLQRTAPVD